MNKPQNIRVEFLGGCIADFKNVMWGNNGGLVMIFQYDSKWGKRIVGVAEFSEAQIKHIEVIGAFSEKLKETTLKEIEDAHNGKGVIF